MNPRISDLPADPAAVPTLRAAALQMVSTPRVDENLRTATGLIDEAVAQGAELLALPEYFAIMGMRDDDKVRLREVDGHGPIQDFLAAKAREHGVWLIGGSLPLWTEHPDKVLNSSLVYNPRGQRAARYDKIHLFGFRQGTEHYDERATIEAGRQPVSFSIPFGRVGLSICYDLRFPELYRAFGVTELLVIPAAFTETTGRAHWEILLRARAIENQCYVLAVAQGGRHENGRETHGNSMLIDPWGNILDRKLKGPGIVIADLERARLAEVRTSLPALGHRVM
ncbi:MAG: carbon-nitrogen hydrolase family protein [Candidatus Accumulibacter phosphatis]|jgi:predicted amidohydrolase|uniref:(R)-stereoselective amidase n=2 Tax=Candidatus Accumulibacter TaxID=327159 RepID=A0A080LU50_9PROT|nr:MULTISPECIES: carbon-nitrogen hydrolase family protein [Candidatus Accumulibacter]KFB72072.1 MAG: (R)-stereoselective amidase [Candidatus Accumulibacter phosphatis]MBL8407881.1 carbon-nitrogen hydrolase family protein [Accumulibacter sp.]NMQ05623.1 carbon-nitrogen hydrolase family protein [Candidatus Accumulibacter contiguus]HRF10576.1 carbon-nitrogen hydrolase family protein [Candidatus Accumulibacter phosphatis]